MEPSSASLASPSMLSVGLRRLSSSSLKGPTIRTAELKQLLASNNEKIKLLDTAYTLKEPENHEEFRRHSYGKFADLVKTRTHADYLEEHLPQARHFNLDIATYPGKYERASLYEEGLFEQYVEMLGINQDDEVILYGRGHSSGMLFAARAWWILRMYGMERVRVLEGGLEKWKREGGETTSEVPPAVKGDWRAKEKDASLIATWEQLTRRDDLDWCILKRLQQINFLDCRPVAEFTGEKPLAFPPNGAVGARIPGSKSVPLSTVISEDGQLKEPHEILKVLEGVGFRKGAHTITVCNGGTQASLLALALVKADVPCRVYNGSLREVSKRWPEIISARD